MGFSFFLQFSPGYTRSLWGSLGFGVLALATGTIIALQSEKMDAKECYETALEETAITHLVTYFDTLPAEARMKLFTTLTRANTSVSAQIGSNFHKELAKQGKVEAFLKLLGG